MEEEANERSECDTLPVLPFKDLDLGVGSS